ncbi:hypothetical protein ACETIH_18090 [Microvirga arabica]|uniref:PepSY domain-containing protein n=1 Tax=Microvirga arabica TaxID=1128671 RepID=A0ABV6YBD2_9HYPH
MRRQSLVVLTAAALAGGSTVALAQGGQAQAANINQNQASSSEARSRIDGPSRFSERSALRRELRQTGFQNIRILDAAFLVQARTQDGRPVVMILSPRDVGSAVTASSVETSRTDGGQDSSAQRPQQFGTTGTVAPSLEQALDLQELTSPMVNPGLVEPGQMREYLQSRGFSDISSLRRDGSFYTGTAQWRGRQVSIRVDTRNGLIVEPEQYLQSQFRQPGLR